MREYTPTLIITRFAACLDTSMVLFGVDTLPGYRFAGWQDTREGVQGWGPGRRKHPLPVLATSPAPTECEKMAEEGDREGPVCSGCLCDVYRAGTRSAGIDSYIYTIVWVG